MPGARHLRRTLSHPDGTRDACPTKNANPERLWGSRPGCARGRDGRTTIAPVTLPRFLNPDVPDGVARECPLRRCLRPMRPLKSDTRVRKIIGDGTSGERVQFRFMTLHHV